MSAQADEFGLDEWAAEDVTPEQKRDWPAWAPLWEGLIFSDLSDRAVRLYAALARYSGEKGAWPTRQTLAKRLHRSPDSIDRAKDELVTTGWMSVIGQTRPSDGAQTSNLYTLHQRPQICGTPAANLLPPPGSTDAAPRRTTTRTTNPPTPQTVVAESGEPTRTYQGTPRTPDMDAPVADPVTPEKIRELRNKIRPPREGTP